MFIPDFSVLLPYLPPGAPCDSFPHPPFSLYCPYCLMLGGLCGAGSVRAFLFISRGCHAPFWSFFLGFFGPSFWRWFLVPSPCGRTFSWRRDTSAFRSAFGPVPDRILFFLSSSFSSLLSAPASLLLSSGLSHSVRGHLLLLDRCRRGDRVATLRAVWGGCWG